MANSAFGVHRGKAAGSRFDERHQEFTMVTSPPTEVLNSDRRYDVAALLLQPPRDFISSSSPEAYRRKPHTVRMVISTTALFLLLFSLMTFPSRQTAFAVGGSVVGWGADDYGAISVPTDATNIVALAAGVVHTLALREDGSLIRWGHAAELPPPGTSNLTSIAAGSFHSMGIRTDGSLWIWSPGQAVMNYPPSATNLIKVSAGNIHVMALRADGRVFAWGEDFWGATVVPGEATNIVDIAAGGTFSVGLRSDGSVLVWGLPGRFTLALSNIVAIGAQYDSVWALRDDGRVFVGNSDSGLSNIVAMDGAAFHWIALSKDGTVAVVGSNSQGQGTIPPGLGNVAAVAAEGEHNLALFNVAGVQIQTPPRSQTSLAGDGVLLSCKALGTMPLSYSWSRDGNLIAQTDVPYLWLRNVQAGDRGAYRATVTNFTGSVTSPPAQINVITSLPRILLSATNLVDLPGATVSVTATVRGTDTIASQWQNAGADLLGETNATLALTNLTWTDSALYRLVATNVLGAVTSGPVRITAVQAAVWGSSSLFQSNVPPVATSLKAVAAGGYHALTLHDDGAVLAWGENSWGQSSPPPGATNVLAITAGDAFSAALSLTGKPVLWGDNYYGQTNVPPAATNVIDLSAGGTHVLALRQDGSVVAWGNSGNGRTTVPAAATNIVRISAGGSHSLASREDGSVLAWGLDNWGQATVPASATNTVRLAAGANHSLALRGDGVVSAWGDNSAGQCTVPADASNIVAIAAGGSSSMALRNDGKVFCWGDNTDGRTNIPPLVTNVTTISAGLALNTALVDRGTISLSSPIANLTSLAGENLVLLAEAVARPPLSYQWLFNGAPIVNETNAWLVLHDSQAASAGLYSVVARNGSLVQTGAVASVTVIARAPVITQPPTSQLATFGGTSTFTVSTTGTKPMGYQWRFNGSNLSGATASTLNITNVQWTNTGTYDVVVSNSLAAVTSTSATLTFQPTVDSFDLGANNFIYALAPQPDGRVLLGGTFTTLGGQPRTNLARLNADGTLDTSFSPSVSGSSSRVNAFALLPDGKILVGGTFNSVSGQSRTNLARLHPDGTFDASFDARVAGSAVTCIAFQEDGKIVLGGSFTNVFGQSRSNLARLNPNGTLDTAFSPAASGSINTLAVQSDGKILVGGNFLSLAGQARTNIGRLNANGSLDTAFNVGTSGAPNAIMVQPDGRILVGGTFITFAGQSRNRIARLNSNGTLDALFNPGANSIVYGLALQADGKILVAGSFTSLGGQARSSIGRVNADGTLDATFDPGANGTVYGLAVQPDGRILAGGIFTIFAGQARSRIARVNNTTPATQTVSIGNTNIAWLRGGASSGIWRATFDVSTNGTDWLSLGDSTYNAGNWQLNVAAPTNATIRARGYSSAGYENGSACFFEDGAGPPAVSLQPASKSNLFDTTATFRVLAAGTSPFTYQWRKDGTNLADGGQVFGASAPTLSLFSVSGADQGGYSVVISNGFGSVTSVVATLKVTEPFITVQPVSQVITSGQTAIFTVTATGTPPLNYQWRKYGTALAGATTSSLTLTNVQWGNGGDYDVLVSNGYGTNGSTVAALALPVGLDALNPDPAGSVYALSEQTDGKILVGGGFFNLGGQTRLNLGRLLPTGSLDTTFNPNVGDTVFSLAVQTDSRILLGGNFSTVGNQSRSRIARINADGSLDTGFNPGANANVNALLVQPDGKILVGGAFTNLAGQTRTFLGRLNADGSLDTAFSPSTSGIVYSLAIQPDGKILVGGGFTNLAGQARTFLGRLNSDGTLDSAFNPSAGTTVYCLAVQPDGKIVVGGAFTTLGGQNRTYLGRLNADGSLDNAFSAANGNVYSLALQTDGRILVGGSFTTLSGQPRSYFGRLNADGSLDSTLKPNAGNVVYAMALQSDGSILAGGTFTTFAGQPRARLARLTNTYPAVQGLTFDGSKITWLRNGASPELGRTVFDYSANGSSWTGLGDGVRIPGGWEVMTAQMPLNATVIARGFVAAGYQASSSWFTENSIGPPAIRTQPASRTNIATTVATFNVVVAGAPPLNCQWFKSGIGLTNGGTISGAQGFSLTISNVLGSDAGQYWVVITNSSDSVTSLVATLNVVDPFLSKQPSSRTNNAGTIATFTIQAAGTPSLNYQWFKSDVALDDKVAIYGAHTATLTLSNVFGADSGSYWSTVSNALGGLTSAVANLSVNDPWLSSQPSSQTVSPGQNPVFSVAAVGTAPVYQWRKGGVGIVGATTPTLTITNAQRGDAGLYDVIVSSAFGSVTSTSAMLTVNLASTDSLNPMANNAVRTIALQADGKILVGGSFSMVGTHLRNSIARLYGNGTLDAAFAPDTVGNSGVYCFGPQVDNRILVGGSFLTLAGQSRPWFGRINSDGSFDPNWDLSASAPVHCVMIDSLGRTLMAGSFGTLGGQSRPFLARLNADGTVDPGFNPGANATVQLLTVQADGKVLACGSFTTLAGQPRNYIGRLLADGSLDTNFTATANAPLHCSVLQPDGKIVVAGSFTNLNGQSRKYIGRFNGDGTLDTEFNPGANDLVYALALQTDGKILAGGRFTVLGGHSRSRLARINPDGTLDSTFDPGADFTVNTLAVQADGRILVGGGFTNLGGQARSNVGRLVNPDPAEQTLTFDGSKLTWLRIGSSPEVWRTSFDASADGTNWTSLGTGTRIPGGWQVMNVSLPMNVTVRARGFVAGAAYFAGSSWFEETRVQLRPELQGVSFSPNLFTTNIRGVPGQAVVIEASSNLVHWTAIATNVVPNGGTVFFTDLDSGGLPLRFYRARYYEGALPAPRIGTGNAFPSIRTNAFGFNLSGVAGQIIVIEASSNLVNWTALATNTLGMVPIFFSDTGWTNFAVRFYRARVP